MKNEQCVITSNRLKQACAESQMSYAELSRKSGVSKSCISHYVAGSHAPTNLSAGRMSEVLNVSPVWLMGFDVGKDKEAFELERRSGNQVALLTYYFNKMNESDRNTILDMAKMFSERGIK